MINGENILKIKNKIFISLILFIVSISCALLFAFNNKAQALTGSIVSTEVKNSYFYGESVELDNVNILYDEQTLTSDGFYVVYPSGKSVEKDIINLNEVGAYKIIYYAKIQDKTIYAEKSFNVTSNLYSVNNSSSTAEYKKPDNYETKGVVVKLLEGDEFRYNKVIDISNYVKGDSIVGFYAIPESFGIADCKDVIIKLTDAYDEKNYIELKMSNVSYLGSWADVAVYLKGSSCGQTFNGIYTNNLGDSWIRNDWGGLCSYFTLTGKQFHTIHTDIDGNIFNFYMDYEKRQMYTDDGLYDNGLIIDLSDKNIFPNAWNGFTTGECFLSIKGEGYQASALNLVITNLDNQNIQNNNLTIENNIIVNIDTDEFEENALPIAKVNKPYKIFNATANSRYQNNLTVPSL